MTIVYVVKARSFDSECDRRDAGARGFCKGSVAVSRAPPPQACKALAANRSGELCQHDRSCSFSTSA